MGTRRIPEARPDARTKRMRPIVPAAELDPEVGSNSIQPNVPKALAEREALSLSCGTMKFAPADPALQLEESQNGIYIRGSNLDPYTRAITNEGNIVYKSPSIPQLISTSAFPKLLHDEAVKRVIDTHPQFPKMMKSLVQVYVFFEAVPGILLEDDNDRGAYSSGIALSDDIVFTALHTFQKPGCHIEKIFVAPGIVPLDTPFELLTSYEAELLSVDKGVETSYSASNGLNSDFLDFAVLKTMKPMEVNRDELLSIDLDKADTLPGDVIVTTGFPADTDEPEYYPEAFFTKNFRKWFEKAIPDTNSLKESLYQFYRNCSFDFELPFVAFGAVNSVENDDFYYVASTCSILKGMSGGPVISTSAPDKLAGLTVGTCNGHSLSLFATAQCPPIKKAYRQYVLHEDTEAKS